MELSLNITVLIQLINFLALLFILNEILFKPILAKLREREAVIRADQEQALALEREVLEQENQHQMELTKARQTAAQDKNDLLLQAKSNEAQILDRARAEAAKIVDDMKRGIEGEANQAKEALQAQMSPLAHSIAQKLLGRPVS